MSESWEAFVGITTVGWKSMVAVVTAVWAFCRVDIGRTVRLLTIAVSMCGTVTFISFHALNAQSDYQPHETIKDAQQDGRMDYIQGEFSDSKQERSEPGGEPSSPGITGSGDSSDF